MNAFQNWHNADYLWSISLLKIQLIVTYALRQALLLNWIPLLSTWTVCFTYIIETDFCLNKLCFLEGGINLYLCRVYASFGRHPKVPAPSYEHDETPLKWMQRVTFPLHGGGFLSGRPSIEQTLCLFVADIVLPFVVEVEMRSSRNRSAWASTSTCVRALFLQEQRTYVSIDSF